MSNFNLDYKQEMENLRRGHQFQFFSFIYLTGFIPFFSLEALLYCWAILVDHHGFCKRIRKIPNLCWIQFLTNIPVQADLQWRVSDLKQEIGKSQNVDPNELRIIFAGRELNNHLKLKVFIPTKVYWMNSYCD